MTSKLYQIDISKPRINPQTKKPLSRKMALESIQNDVFVYLKDYQ